MTTKNEMREVIQSLAMEVSKRQDWQNSSQALVSYFEEYSHLLIYDAGSGAHFVYGFMQSDMPEFIKKISGFIDKNAENKPECLGYPVYKPDDMRLSGDFRKNALVIFALGLQNSEYDELQEQLQTLGYQNFVNGIYKIGAESSWSYKAGCIGIPALKNVLPDETEDVLAAFDLMYDEHSQHVFESVFRAHATNNWELPMLSVGMTQYLDVGVPFRYNYCNFVDCGAFTGDTFEELIKRYKVERYFGFEPDMGNFAKLSSNLNKWESKAGLIVLFPTGVSDRNDFLQFYMNEHGNISRIDEQSNVTIQVVCLDDVIKNCKNLMIKMDIEGAEVAALNGARRLITETKPDLAISVYHKISDLWRIPLMLKEWVPEYQFYLRNHTWCAVETVLYCHV